VVPLERSENRWTPAKIAAPAGEEEIMSQEYIIRKVNALLNKLTVDKFDSIAAQIFDYARQSEKEDDGCSLRTVMKLTFEKACDEPNFVSMWARLCRSMYDAMTEKIRDVGILNEKKEPVSGVLLFRKYLFNRCQAEFEKGWKVNMPESEEAENLLSDEYYIAAKAKRQGLGLIAFIGELFKNEMLSERIMYTCILRLCNDPSNAGDEEAESLCKLLTTIGKVLDHKPKTSKWLDVIIGRMRNEMVNSPKISSRVKFMIQDLVDLRREKWVPRNQGTQVVPTTIAKIHEMAEKAKEEKDAAHMKRTNSARGPYIPNNNNNNNNNQYNNNNNGMARTGSYRGGNKENNFYNNNNNTNNSHNGNAVDGWSTVSPTPNSKTRVADLSNFGKTDRSRSKSSMLSPSYGPFASLSRGKSPTAVDNPKSPTEGRSSPATNMFSALSNGGSTDNKEKVEEQKPAAVEAKPKLSGEALKRRCKNILEEYFGINDKTVSNNEVYFSDRKLISL
jgi:translation initiation factor 4G